MKKAALKSQKTCRKILLGRLNLCLLFYKETFLVDLPCRKPITTRQKEIRETIGIHLTTAEEYGIINNTEKLNLDTWTENWTKNTSHLTNFTSI